MKLRQGSLQSLLDQTNRDLNEARDELAAMTAKLATRDATAAAAVDGVLNPPPPPGP